MVEDNPNDAELTLRALKKHNLANSVHIAKDGNEALEFLFAKGPYADRNMEVKPKLVLLDIKLPKISGIEVLKKIKSDPKMKTIPVVMMTSSKEGPDIEECYNLGANSYIVKPVEFEKFVEVVSQLGFYWVLLNQPPA